MTDGVESSPTGGRARSWSALKSGYHAVSGLMWVAPRTPSLKLGVVVVAVLLGVGVVLKLRPVEIAVLVLGGAMVLAVETLNTAVEMLCDHVQPDHHPQIGKVKDVAAGATVIVEIGVALVVLLLIAPRVWQLLGH